MKHFGHMLCLDLYECNPVAIDDLNICYEFLDKGVDVIGVHKQAPPQIFRSPLEFEDKVGLSGGVYLIESNITIHTLTVKKYVSIIFYTCSNMTNKMQQALIDFATETFTPKRIDSKFLKLGKEYHK